MLHIYKDYVLFDKIYQRDIIISDNDLQRIIRGLKQIEIYLQSFKQIQLNVLSL